MTESLLEAQVSALMAVPLIAFKRVVPVIYLDSRDGGARFEEDHLQLPTGIAGIAAAALETALLLERLEKENQKLKAEISIQHDIVGSSPQDFAVIKHLDKASPKLYEF